MVSFHSPLVYLVDDINDFLTVVRFKSDQFALMQRRGWFETNEWMFDHPVLTMKQSLFVEFLKEVSY